METLWFCDVIIQKIVLLKKETVWIDGDGYGFVTVRDGNSPWPRSSCVCFFPGSTQVVDLEPIIFSTDSTECGVWTIAIEFKLIYLNRPEVIYFDPYWFASKSTELIQFGLV
jgi:hypothetical protein